jgi:exodeoxyribonuclease V alpha subunit
MEELTGKVASIRGPYKGGWCVLRVQPGAHTVVGSFGGGVQVGDCMLFKGKWGNHPTYGKQFQSKFHQVDVPKDVAGIKEYMRRHLSGIGAKTADALVRTFGGEVLQIIEESPGRLSEIDGISREGAQRIYEQYQGIKERQGLDVFCSTNGISEAIKARLTTRYGASKVIGVVKRNPYIIADDVHGIGFVKADNIAMGVGIKKDAPFRLRAGTIYTLKEAKTSGHCFLTTKEFPKRASKLLDVSTESALETAISLAEADESGVTQEDERLYLDRLHYAEKHVASILASYAKSTADPIKHDLTEEQIGTLDKDQAKALELALASKICVITGGPGVGKTYTLKTILEALGDRKIALAAPTGKAAKRMIESTGRHAATIHKLLGYNPITNSFEFNLYNTLPADVIVIDESSMIDIELMLHLLNATRVEKHRLIFVGDKDQLPSVGPGAVLGDIIKSEKIPVAYLRTLHRQAAHSLININAQAINAGELPKFDSDSPDMWFLEEDNAEAIPELIKDVCESIGNLGFDMTDVQILCPQKKGPIGTGKLNGILQKEVFNPDGASIRGTSFRIGDRVIQLRNNYKLDVVNGDTGTITGADHAGKRVGVRFSGPVDFDVEYTPDLYEQLSLSYALTIHKSQGSEYPVVVIPCHTTNYIMLRRNLLYTAITRGKQQVVLIGNWKAVRTAVKTIDGSSRNTRLATKIQEFSI